MAHKATDSKKQVGNWENPRIVLRGFNSQKPNNNLSGIHWLRGTLDKSKFAILLDFLRLFWKEETPQKIGRYLYERRMLFASGAAVYYCNTEERSKVVNNTVCLDVSGGVFDAMNADEIDCLLTGLQSLGFRASRLDAFYDDYERIIEPWELAELIDREFLRIGKKIYSGFSVHEPDPKYKQGYLIKDCIGFGNRGNNGGGKYLRVYDKALETKLETETDETTGAVRFVNTAIRWECELSDDKADKAFQQIAKLPVQQQAGAFSSIVAGCIDFYERNATEKNLSRCNKYPFWKYLVEKMSAVFIDIKTPAKSTDIDKKKIWIEKQVGASLVTIRKAIGSKDFFDWILDIMDDGRYLRTRHIELIEKYRRELSGQRVFDVGKMKAFFDSQGIEFNRGNDESI